MATGFNTLAVLYQMQGRLDEARPLYERARHLWLAVAWVNAPLEEPARRHLMPEGHYVLGLYLQLLAILARAPEPEASGDTPARDAFVVAEQRRSSAAQAALLQATARAAATDPTLAPLVQTIEARRAELSALRTKLLAAGSGLPSASQLPPAQQEALQARERALSAELLSAVTQWYAACPRCAELAVPEPITIAEVQALLRPGEALLSYAGIEDRLLLWLIRPERPLVFHELAVDTATLTRQIAKLRRGLEQNPRDNPSLALGEPCQSMWSPPMRSTRRSWPRCATPWVG